MKEQKIKDIVDAYLQKWSDLGLNKQPANVHPAMADSNQDKNEEWRIWHPIPSTVSGNEIEEVEKQLGHPLPADYKIFLKHKHFYDLQISEVSFCEHAIDTWKNALTDMAFDGFPQEYLIDKGYLPFADWSDWGVLCFDTNTNKGDNNYPVVLWDHEMVDDVQEKYNDFFDLLIKVDMEDKENSN